MSQNSENIEARLIPYIEGVLNEREQQEVAQAIEADAALAREVDELKELIGDLRGAFASGMQTQTERLSVEEIVEMASHDGRLDTMSGTVDQKARLFCNDQSLEEYRLLRGLSEEMQKTTLPMAEVPPMPESFLAEVARYKSSGTPKVVPFAPKLTPEVPSGKGGFFGFLDRFDPKPLMATAAAFVLLSLGFHVYNTPANHTMSGDREVALGQRAPTPAASPVSEVAVVDGKTVVEPTGVTVFTSGDRELLKEQAEKLLAEKVRYTVTEDRILVSEKEVAQARAVLWGEEDSKVAMGEKTSAEEQLRTSEGAGPGQSAPMRPAIGSARPEESESEEFEPPTVTYSNLRKTPGRSQKGTLNSYSADEPTDDGVGLGEDSALKRSDKDEPNWSSSAGASGSTERPSRSAGLATGTASAGTAPEATELKGASKSEREKILRSMAMGQSGSEPPPPVPSKVRMNDQENAPARQEISRARVSTSPEENRTAPVANVITADSVAVTEAESENENGDVVEAPGGAVARSHKTKQSRPAATSATRGQAGYVPGDASSSGVVVESKGDVDLRLAAVRSNQATVARRYDVVISVETVGDTISVYIRPNKELSTTELDELRRAIRADLGLSAADSIVFR